MKTLVIGGAGYIGSHVVKALMKSGHQVTVFDNLSSGLRQNLFKENEFIYGNILIKEDLDSAFSQGFDACIHLAAFKAAGESMIKPEKYSVNNITGTLNILNSATKYNCKNIVFLPLLQFLVILKNCQLMKIILKIQKIIMDLQNYLLKIILNGIQN